ncbi:NACHT domain- and WD repeat-containing protein 1-like isoform X2 [Mercenaria mercenaria]|uniref:NACHT domain- and WD repeat-containing protein 1-like isoform X2 n=1 Tax=Mercenaria mercenaria TaxID=6596 RepID=UPI00234F539B|nr:NACHT domain- and WD repeat-containing protein 1-like isoform X2 [Mercenaria mercenaria]
MGSGSSKPKKKETGVKNEIRPARVDEPSDKQAPQQEEMFKAYKAEQNVPETKADDKSDAARADELPWKQALDKVAGMELWGGKNREQRSPWKEYLQKADDILKKPRRAIPKEVVGQILEGDMTVVDISSVPTAQPKVVVFVSSTFTDTKAERNHLMKDVYPYLRGLCRRLGVDFGTVDMRWGVTQEATLDHSTVEMCVNEIHRCVKDSVGPAFLCLMGHKYGYRPLPAQIEQSEFETLLNHLQQTGHDTSLINNYYFLDNNAVPSEFVLKPRTEDNETWWDDVEGIQKQFREASVACFGEQNKKCDKYHISVTETEIHTGVFNNPTAQTQACFIRRDLAKFSEDFHKDRKILDLVGPNIDEYARDKLAELRKKKIPSKVPPVIVKDMIYEEAVPKQVAEKIKDLCEHVCKTMADGILENYENRLHVEEDRVFQEALQHRSHASEKASLFVGRENEIRHIMDYMRSSSTKPLVVHGQSGCGKTALMAVAARKAKDAFSHAVVVLRFLGTTGQTASARLLLLNVCAQITRVYNKNLSAIPTSYKDLVKYFRTCLAFATSSKPAIVFLDSLDQLNNEDFGQNLAWLSLSEDLPPNVKFVVSSLPTRSLDILKSHLNDAVFVEVRPLSLDEGPEILKKMLEAKHRRVTESQKSLIIDAFKKCPLPLFLRLVVDIAERWKSFDTVDSSALADDMPGLITKLFDRLESRFGDMFVHHALGYITAAKNGLSLAELEDILSCDDEVLDSIFQWWIPPIRRIPPLLWARVRNELGIYLAEKGTDGISAYGWYHRQFWETAEKRYLQKPFNNDTDLFVGKAHTAIADYFEGKWDDGKPYTSKGETKIEDRKIAKQSLVLGGNRSTGRQLNRRKLTELPYHLIKIEEWDRFRKLVIDLEYIEAKFEAGDGYNCLSELIEATKLSGLDDIKRLTRFVGSNLGFLIREPTGVYQMALQQARGSNVRELLGRLSKENLPLPLMENLHESDYDDPCEMTMHGHTETLRCCDYSPKGDLILSSADDCTMRIWDATTGAEIVTITSLPGPIFPDKNEGMQLMLHPVNPSCFSRSGETIANGTEIGEVMLWDKSGVQLHSKSTPNKAVVYIHFSPDNRQIATAFKNSVLSIWSADDLSHVKTVDFDWLELTCLDYSRDGKKLAVMCLRGLILLDTDGYNVTSKETGSCYNNLCSTFHPSGSQVMTGGDDSCVSIWNGNNGTYQTKLKEHNAWIWTIKFTPDGKHMFTGSSDRSMKVWRQTGGSWSVIATVGGHSHRVSMISLEENGNKLVTSSIDRSLKVWDTATLLRGAVPPVGGGHYLTCVISPNGSFLAIAQGWMKQCGLLDAAQFDQSPETYTDAHKGFIKMAQFSSDSSRLFVLDHGHSGGYEAGSEKYAAIEVRSLLSGSSSYINVQSPYSFTLTNTHVVVGTFYGELHLFDINSYSEILKWKSRSGGAITRVAACNAGGKYMIAACFGTVCQVWEFNGSSVNLVGDMSDHDTDIYDVAFSPDGHYLVNGVGSGKLYIWDTSNKNISLFRIATEHASYIKDIKFSTSGNYLVTSAGLSMRVWDVKDGMSLLCTYYAPVNCASFFNDSVVIVGEATGNRKYLQFRTDYTKSEVTTQCKM